MSSNQNAIDDNYVAKLLAEDAAKSSARYASIGLQALLPKRPTNSAPKPNTRFLRNIIRETDSHNAALKRKEELEARQRLRKIRQNEPDERRREQYDGRRASKRRRVSEDNDNNRRRKHDGEELRLRRNTSSGESEDGDSSRYARRRRQTHNLGSPVDESKKGSREHRHLKSEPLLKRKGVEERSHRLSTHLNRRKLSPSPEAHVTLHYDKYHEKEQDPFVPTAKSRQLDMSLDGIGDRATMEEPDESVDSDPLESLLGPLPAKSTNATDPSPLRPRGRGAYKPSASTMDAHFAPTYNPKADVHLESEVDEEREDWDMALEALRDREAWKQKHTERLREAGFGDAEIKRWEGSSKEKTVADVKWSGKGQAREWDLGKVIEDNEKTSVRQNRLVESAWARKDGGFLGGFKNALR